MINPTLVMLKIGRDAPVVRNLGNEQFDSDMDESFFR